MTEPGLFPEPEHTDPPPAASDALAGLTPDQRRRWRQDRMIEDGWHPMTKVPLLHSGWGLRCGDCSHRVIVQGGAKRFGKCETVPMTHGPGTDCLARFPACERFEQRAP